MKSDFEELQLAHAEVSRKLRNIDKYQKKVASQHDKIEKLKQQMLRQSQHFDLNKSQVESHVQFMKEELKRQGETIALKDIQIKTLSRQLELLKTPSLVALVK